MEPRQAVEPAAGAEGRLWDTVPRLLDQHRYLVLGTVDAAGTPWVTPLFFVADSEHRVLWVSSPDSRHSRNIAARPAVAVTLFDTAAPIGGAEAIYADASAGQVEEGTRTAALELLNAHLPPHQQLGTEDIGPSGPLEIYEARVSRYYVLVRGGDPRTEDVTDTAVPAGP